MGGAASLGRPEGVARRGWLGRQRPEDYKALAPWPRHSLLERGWTGSLGGGPRQRVQGLLPLGMGGRQCAEWAGDSQSEKPEPEALGAAGRQGSCL